MRAGRLLLFHGDFDQTATVPFVDSTSTVYPAALGKDQTVLVPFIDSGSWVWPAGVALASASTSAMVVKSYSRAGALLATLDESHTRSFLDQIDDTGTFRLAVQNDDADLTHTGFDRLVRYEIGGLARFAGLVEARNVVTYAPGEDADEVTALTGRGSLAVLSEARVYPSRGVGSLPIEEVRSFSWVAPDFDDTGWPTAKALCRQDKETTYWDSTQPAAWPNPAALRIWADVDTASTENAPGGICLFRDTFTVATAGTFAIFAAWDNMGEFYIDGAQVITSGTDYHDGRRVLIDLSAGTHYIASSGHNEAAASGNPANFLATIHPVDKQGLLDAAIWSTSATTKCLPYVDAGPGWSPGKVLRLLLEDAQADGKLLDVTLGFTDTVDSDGAAWDLSPEISVGVGRSNLLDVVREMAASTLDVAMAPGKLELRAWKFGTRGTTKAVDLQNTTSVATSQLTGLSHDGRRTGFNALLIRYAGGWTEVLDAASIAASWRRDDYLELGWVQSETEAQRIGTEHMAIYSAPRYSSTASIDPSSDATTPYLAFEVGDTPNCIDETGVLDAMRVRSIALNETDTGLLQWGVELRDIMLEQQDRHENWLRRMASGTLAGGSRVASPAGTAPITDVQLTSVRVGEFSYEGTIADGTNISLLLNGTIIETLAFTATSSDEQTAFLDLAKVHGDSDWLQVQVGAVLADASMRRPAETSGNLLTFAVTRTLAADGTAGMVAQARGV